MREDVGCMDGWMYVGGYVCRWIWEVGIGSLVGMDMNHTVLYNPIIYLVSIPSIVMD